MHSSAHLKHTHMSTLFFVLLAFCPVAAALSFTLTHHALLGMAYCDHKTKGSACALPFI